MKLNLIKLFTIGTLVAIMQSCSSDYSQLYESKTGGDESHNMGKNCMNCHKPKNFGIRPWSVAGTIFKDARSNIISKNPTTINLYTGPNATGTLKYSIQSDANGNFYTSADIDFSAGLYPSVTGATSINSMTTAVTSGACSSCHNGLTQNRVWSN